MNVFKTPLPRHPRISDNLILELFFRCSMVLRSGKLFSCTNFIVLKNLNWYLKKLIISKWNMLFSIFVISELLNWILKITLLLIGSYWVFLIKHTVGKET